MMRNTSPKPCAGRACGANNGEPHSPECLSDYEAACADLAGDGTQIDHDAVARQLLAAAEAGGRTKLPLSMVPATAIDVESLAFLNGALKYGRANWRACGVRASIYLDAARRHISAWENGEENDAEGVPHLGSARACMGIIIDAMSCGKLNDDRPPSIDLAAHRARLTPIVGALTKRHADRHPRHYSISDTAPEDDAAVIRRRLMVLGLALRGAARSRDVLPGEQGALRTAADQIDDILATSGGRP
jgi:hypothetical protein